MFRFRKQTIRSWLLALVGLMMVTMMVLLTSRPAAVGAQGELDRWAGTVVDQDGNALAATITINETESRAGDDGSFELYVPRDRENRYLINAQMMGYALYSQVHIGASNESMAITLNRAQVFPLDPSQDNEVQDEQGTMIQIPANSLVDADGNPASGSINLLLDTFDIQAGEMPGDMTGRDRDGQLVALESSGAFFAEFRDADGNYYNLAPGAEAQISVPVSEALPNAPDTIQLWSYDEESGIWIEEGEATQENGRYVGNVNHFSAWNFDMKWSDAACIKLTVDPVYLALNSPLQVVAKVYYGSTSTSAVRVKNLSITSTTNVLINLAPNPPTDAEVRFFYPGSSTPFAIVSPGAAWGGSWIPPFPYDDCNGSLHIAGAPQLVCANAEGYPGDTLMVDLTATGTDVYGLQATATVSDPTIAAPNSASFGNFFTTPYLVAANIADASAGSWLGAVSQQNPNPPVTGSDIFATISYDALTPGTTSVALTALYSDRDGFQIPDATTTDCQLTVLAYGEVDGAVTYQGRLTHANIVVVATGPVTNNALTDAAGAFNVGTLQAGNYDVSADAPSYLPACRPGVNVLNGSTITTPAVQLLGGDVNDDVDNGLVINIGDATRLGASFGMAASADTQADINADGTINIQDFSILGGNYGVSGCQTW